MEEAMTKDWDKHYRNGGNSGDPNDYAKHREFRIKSLDSIIDDNTTVLDLGCGDLQAWYGKELGKNYTGIDISQTIIERNQKRYPEALFLQCDMDDIELLPGCYDVVICCDVLFHIMDDYTYARTLRFIAERTNKFALAQTLDRNYLNGILPRLMRLKNTGEFTFRENTTDGVYQKYRRFEDIPKYFPGFKCESPAAGMYIFRKVGL